MTIISLQAVQKSFGEKQVLKDINLNIASKERLVICGPSGSGKSTLIRTLNGLEKIQSGAIEVLGLNPQNTDHVLKIRQNLGFVFQQFNLFPHLTVLENCTLGPIKVQKKEKEEAQVLAESYLAKLGLEDFAHRYPISLSGGQQQRVAICRALSMQPQIMVMDEPTSSLDPEMTREVLQTMLALTDEDLTLILVTHEMDFARKVATRLVFMENGVVIEDGESPHIWDHPQSPRLKSFLNYGL